MIGTLFQDRLSTGREDYQAVAAAAERSIGVRRLLCDPVMDEHGSKFIRLDRETHPPQGRDEGLDGDPTRFRVERHRTEPQDGFVER
jgi:hypothetical protein